MLSFARLPQIHPDRDIRGITLDSRKVKTGYLFAALPGNRVDGNQFIHQAIENGAIAVLLPEKTPWPPVTGCIPIYSPNPRLSLSQMLAAFYPDLPRHQITVTGTNGKTSTVDFCRQLWELQRLKSASIGTLGVLNTVNYQYQGPVLTTPDPVTLHEILHDLAIRHVDHVAMEASSHGLVQYRMDGIKIEAAGFTNLTRDHLDYHHDFRSYFQAKQRLFTDILPENGIAALNADMNPSVLLEIRNLVHQRKQKLRLVGEQGDFLRLHSVIPLPQGQKITISHQQNAPFSVTVPLLGRYQIDNVLLAMALILQDTRQITDLIPLLPHLTGVRGRMEQAAILPNGATVYVDYAHTPDAITHLLQSLRPHVHHKLYIVFGAGGDRDKGKRPLMAQAAGKHADHIIITDDNPRSEPPAQIRQEVRAGFPDALEIAGREAAIAHAIHELEKGDILVVAGKGHEQGQIIGNVTYPFDDIEVIRKHAAGIS